MKRFYKFFVGIVSATLLVGCLKDYQELNTDDELLTSVDPRNVFTGATENYNNSSRSHLLGKYSGTMRLMQYIVSASGGSEGIYFDPTGNSRPSIYTPYYSDYYSQIGLQLRYLVNTVIPNNTEKLRYQNLAAIATMLETYQAWLMFDVNGAAPYTEAFMRTSGIFTPRYDLYQNSVNNEPLYKVFDKKIKESVAVLQQNLPNQYDLGGNDYFYKGNVNYWIKFGNTLRIKMAQRLEVADNAFYISTLEDALSNTGGIISSNSESCVYHHPNEYNDNTDDMQGLTSDYCASRAFVNFLKTYNDPRLPLLVRRNGWGQGNNNKTNDAEATTLATYFTDYQTSNKYLAFNDRYFGISANPDSSSTKWSRSAYYDLTYLKGGMTTSTLSIRHNSQIESRFYVKNGGKVGNTLSARDKEDSKYDVAQTSISLFTPLITYPEVCFMMAEIALKSGGSKGGKSDLAWFHDGIRASMQQYQEWATQMAVPSAMDATSDNYNPITDTKINDYLQLPEFQTVTLEKIVSQQWVNLFMRPEEMWATWKRTGFPSFKNDPTPVDGVAYLETVTKGGTTLVLPRRGMPPTPNAENTENYNKAIENLKKDPAYGALESYTEGRIWWDKN